MQEGRQLCLFENSENATRLQEWLWCRSFDQQQSSLHLLAPYESRLRVSRIQALLSLYSQPGDVVCDPFSGSGKIALEAALAGRQIWANDLSPYAWVLTRGKLEAPANQRTAVKQAIAALEDLESAAAHVDLEAVPAWVQAFFHPDTLRELIVAFERLQQQNHAFLMACLLGILHHIRPGFLSYPTSQEAPYLRRVSYPPEQFPQLYSYRDVRSRLLAKIRRVYRRHSLPDAWKPRCRVWQVDSRTLPIDDGQVSLVLSSPPHSGALSYACNHRLRLWFLGCAHWRSLDAQLISGGKRYSSEMASCLQEIERILKPGGYALLLLNDVACCGKTRRTAEILAELAIAATRGSLEMETVYDDFGNLSGNPAQAVSLERVLILRKRAAM